MGVRQWSTRKVQDTYDRLRKRYFLDVADGLHVPPPACALRWGWLSESSMTLGLTHFDEDDEPESIDLSLLIRRIPHEVRRILLHELTHMRLGPRVPCPSETKKRVPSLWQSEAMRLAALGADLL